MYTLTFKLYTFATGGTEIWTETSSVIVYGGVYSVQLGAKRVGFVLAFQAYGVEQENLTFVYDQNGANVKMDLTLPVNDFAFEMFTF